MTVSQPSKKSTHLRYSIIGYDPVPAYNIRPSALSGATLDLTLTLIVPVVVCRLKTGTLVTPASETFTQISVFPVFFFVFKLRAYMKQTERQASRRTDKTPNATYQDVMHGTISLQHTELIPCLSNRV